MRTVIPNKVKPAEVEVGALKNGKLITVVMRYRSCTMIYKPVFVNNRGWFLYNVGYDQLYYVHSGGTDIASSTDKGKLNLSSLLSSFLRSSNVEVIEHTNEKEMFQYLAGL